MLGKPQEGRKSPTPLFSHQQPLPCGARLPLPSEALFSLIFLLALWPPRACESELASVLILDTS